MLLSPLHPLRVKRGRRQDASNPVRVNDLPT